MHARQCSDGFPDGSDLAAKQLLIPDVEKGSRRSHSDIEDNRCDPEQEGCQATDYLGGDFIDAPQYLRLA